MSVLLSVLVRISLAAIFFSGIAFTGAKWIKAGNFYIAERQLVEMIRQCSLIALQMGKCQMSVTGDKISISGGGRTISYANGRPGNVSSNRNIFFNGFEEVSGATLKLTLDGLSKEYVVDASGNVNIIN